VARTHKFKIKARTARSSANVDSRDHASHSPFPTANDSGSDVEHVVPLNHNVVNSDLRQLQLPAYITPLSMDIPPDDLHVLMLKNALTFPPMGIANDIIRSFFCYVYPLLPIVRLDTFLAAIQGESGATISPLLFQAVLLAGAVFTDFSRSQHPDFQQSKDVQRLLYGRVKVIFDMDVETNPIVMIQSLLLMTYWHSKLNDAKGRVYWLRIAISLATDIGLNNADLQRDQPKEDAFRRQLWCCCLIRTQLIAIGERRQVELPTAVANDAHVSVARWDSNQLSQALNAYSVPYTGQQLDMLGMSYVQQVKLCQIIQHILDVLYELSGVKTDTPSDSIMLLIPNTRAARSTVVTLDERLREWYKNASQSGVFNRGSGDLDVIFSTHSATLEMLYFTALLAVHRPLMLQQPQQSSAAEALHEFSSTTLRSSASQITEIGRDLDIHHRICHLPPVATTMFMAASIQHLRDAMSTNLERCHSGSLYLGQTLRIFRLLGDRYNHVNTAIDFISRLQNGDHFDHSVAW
jgi:hypothetical protein